MSGRKWKKSTIQAREDSRFMSENEDEGVLDYKEDLVVVGQDVDDISLNGFFKFS